MDATLEHLRISAIKGHILDAAGSAVIYDLFTELGVTQHTEFDLDNATPAPGVINPAQNRGRAGGAAAWAHPCHLRRRLLRRPDLPLRGREGV